MVMWTGFEPVFQQGRVLAKPFGQLQNVVDQQKLEGD
jgi:hypothetical protein